MKKLLCLILALVLLPLFSMAEEEESAADTLLLSEITEWIGYYHQRAMESEPLNDPALDQTEEGYQHVYEFATLYADSPIMSNDTVVYSVTVTLPGERGPRGVCVEDDVNTVLAAFYTDNPQLRGSYDSAVIYSLDMLPETCQWAEVQRDGQRIHTIQYAVHDQLTTGGDGYTDAGIVFTMEENLVGAIRAYGTGSRITGEEVRTVLGNVAFRAMDTSYAMVPTSYEGGDLAKFDSGDLLFSGLDFLGMTAEDAIAVLGTPSADTWMDDGEYGHIRSLSYENCEIVFTYDVDKITSRVYMMLITADGIEGPRAVRIGDSFASVLNRFRYGEGEYSDEDMTELLYGSIDGSEYGLAEYGITTLLRYGLTMADGTQVSMMLTFEMTELSEVMLYIAD